MKSTIASCEKTELLIDWFVVDFVLNVLNAAAMNIA
jgi:hypothetical protein